MKKSFHVFSRMFTKKGDAGLAKVNIFLFVIFAVLAVQSAWADCNPNETICGSAGSYYTNVPSTGKNTVYLDANMSSIDVRNESEHGRYLPNSKGKLVLVAPPGYILQARGSVNVVYGQHQSALTIGRYDLYDWSDYVAIYDGNTTEKKHRLFKSDEENKGYANDAVITSGQEMTFYFYSDGSHEGPGLNMTVTLHKVNMEVECSNISSGLSCGARLLPKGSYTLTLPDPLTTGVNKFYIDGSVYPKTSSVLNITAPEGYMMELTGKFVSTYFEKIELFCYGKNCHYYDMEKEDDRLYATIYDPDNAVWLSLRYLSTEHNGKLFSSGRHLTLSLNSKDEPMATSGYLYLTITLREINMNIQGDVGGYYVNMYAKNRAYLSIPRDVTTFSVYDDGGEREDYSNYAGAALELEAPEGRYLQVESGSVKTRDAGDSLIIYDGVYTEVWRGNNSNVPNIQSSGQKMTLVFKSDAAGTSSGFKLDVKVRHSVEGTLSLEQDKIARDTSVFRDASYSLYAKINGLQTVGFDAKFQCRYETADGWSDWEKLNYGGMSASFSDDSYDVKITPETQNVSGKLCSPSNAVQSQFRMRIIPLNRATGKEIADTAYTDTVSVKFKNKVVVDAKITNTLLGDYSVLSENGIKINKDDGILCNKSVSVQAIAPAGYRFWKWTDKFGSIISQSNPMNLTVVSDTAVKAVFEANIQDIKVATFVSKNGSTTWSSSENSPLEVDVVNPENFKVTSHVVATEELCPSSLNCRANIVIRKEGETQWNELVGKTAIKIPNKQGSYTVDAERGMNGENNTLLMKDGGRFEIKTIVYSNNTNATLAQSNSIFANLYHTVSLGCFSINSESYDYQAKYCKAVLENEQGFMQDLYPNLTSGITVQHGAKIKLHPVYFGGYTNNFVYWKDGYKQNSNPEIYLTKDSVYEVTVDSDLSLAIGYNVRANDIVRILPENSVMPYAGMTDFNLTLVNEGENGKGEKVAEVDFAADTAFYIEKYGLAEKFAVNKLDSMFTPGYYTLVVKLVNKGPYKSETDSLWACEATPRAYLINQSAGDGYFGDYTSCTADSPATGHYRYSFSVDDTTFNVVFKKWDEVADGYVEAKTQKVSFGESPTAPKIECPESNASWNISCEWSSAIVPAYKDAEYSYELKGARKKAVIFETIDEKYTAIINGDFSGEGRVDFASPVKVDSIAYNRKFTPLKPATVVLPFDLPEGSSVNAKFYYLESVKQVGMSWKATMRNIGAGNLPVANTPYAVILQNDETLKFELAGQATFQTDDIFSTKVSDGKWQFVGVYSYKVWEEGNGELGLAYAFAGSDNVGGAAKGEFGKIKTGENSTPYANPLRAYLRKTDESVQLVNPVPKGRPAMLGESSLASLYNEDLPETIDVEFVDDDGKTSFVSRMNTRTGEFEMLRNYDLKGRKLNGKPAAHKAYYGKKIIKK